MESNNGFNQDLLNLIEGSRFKSSKESKDPRRLKRKEPSSINIEYENPATPHLATAISTNKPPSITKPLPSIIKPILQSSKNNHDKFMEMYSAIKEMRKDRNAPVDLLGAQVCPDESEPKEVQDYQLLVAQILSVQTTDVVVNRAMERLKKHGLTIENISNTDEKELVKLISDINYKNNKVKYIKKSTEMLIQRFKRRVPSTLEDLLKLPGIGKETGIGYLNMVYKQNFGIGIDVHVHRIANRVAWVETRNPDQTRTELESFVPREYWGELTELMIGFGQQICTAIAPKCSGCLLNSVCPTGIKNLEPLKNEKPILKKTKKEEEKNPDPDEIEENIEDIFVDEIEKKNLDEDIFIDETEENNFIDETQQIEEEENENSQAAAE